MSNNSFDSQSFLKQLTEKPGVYRMLDAELTVIYVGKAKNLKKRVSSYFNKNDHSIKTRVMVQQIHSVEVTVTNTETEALLLENNLIKELKPRYNVVFRDDKSYPYVFLSKGKYPRLVYHRGAKKASGDYYGPFPSSGAVRQSLSLLQKLFKVRQCEDSVFSNRSRPCLQYQIKRCTAPCVNYITEENYAKDVQLTRLFYQGKSEQVIDTLRERMDVASEKLEFEEAAALRDQIVNMRKVIEKQVISGTQVDMDVFSFAIKAGMAVAVILFVRKGKVLGSKNFYPRLPKQASIEELVNAFVVQFYLAGKEIPAEILLSHSVEDLLILNHAVNDIAEKKVKVTTNVRGDRADWLRLANSNADQALQSKLNLQANQQQKVYELQQQLGLDVLPNRMECFDISHTMGEGTVASCVVFDEGKPNTSLYRRFNIKDVTPGDDYAAIKQAVYRRYSRLIKEESNIPDLILIDGGKGQLKVAQEALDELGLKEACCISVAKGSDRKMGMEQIFHPGKPVAQILEAESMALHLIQHIRDESHRFAISGHRQRRAKARNKSWLENISGIGAVKRRELLKHFGGLRMIENASIDDLLKVKGINSDLARKIYDYLHE